MTDRGGPARPELWGGIECSVVRVGEDWRDQVRETGHIGRPDDLDRIAGLGITTLRHPLLWEHVAPDRPDERDWRWYDERLARLRDLGMRPILGLVHHGSGPAYTSLDDPAFPEKLAEHARAAARRYPWVQDWTPVNEPVTTARFSGLYGHWYPHRADFPSFCRMLVNQCRGVVLAMRAIRETIPHARLVQTEDMGISYSTPRLRAQAAHENERRWISFDLLCGRVTPEHPWWKVLQDAGVGRDELEAFRPADAAPDVLGINHYLTSERFLDERTGRYPAHFAGGNGRVRYADVEAVRLEPPPGPLGPAARLREVWERYRRPVAVTEAHHGCPDMAECTRWLAQIWHEAAALRDEGADIRAVTVWALFGSVDWRSLLRRRDGAYEPGPFDVRHGTPRRTALADLAEHLARTGALRPDDLARPGWWQRPERVYEEVTRRVA